MIRGGVPDRPKRAHIAMIPFDQRRSMLEPVSRRVACLGALIVLVGAMARAQALLPLGDEPEDGAIEQLIEDIYDDAGAE